VKLVPRIDEPVLRLLVGLVVGVLLAGVAYSLISSIVVKVVLVVLLVGVAYVKMAVPGV